MKHHQMQLAALLVKQGNLCEASKIYLDLINSEQVVVDAYLNLAAIYGMTNKLSLALDLLEKLIIIDPGMPEAHNNLGNIYLIKGDTEKAKICFLQAISIKDDYPHAHYNIGRSLQIEGSLVDAIKYYRKSCQLDPSYGEAFLNLGIVLRENGDPREALLVLHAASALLSNNPEYFYQIGRTYWDLNKSSDAIESFKLAVKLDPSFSKGYNNLGIILSETNQFIEALTNYNHALAIDPMYSLAWNNKANLLKDLGEYSASIQCYQKAIEINPNYDEARKNLGILYLLLGDFKQGLPLYEYRYDFESDSDQFFSQISGIRWYGQPISNNKKLIVVAEQGLGDIIQFYRYVIALKRMGWNVLFCADDRIQILFKQSGIPFISNSDLLLLDDFFWCPLASLPLHLTISPLGRATHDPYLRINTNDVISWRGSISKKSEEIIIGINWSSNIEGQQDRSRSIHLYQYESLNFPENSSLLSLQTGYATKQLEDCDFIDRFIDIPEISSETYSDLHIYAAIISCCDLVVTSATTVAHFAGALGVPVWVLVSSRPDWRWGISGDTSFWYPSMRLFRKGNNEAWNVVIKRLSNQLYDFCRQ